MTVCCVRDSCACLLLHTALSRFLVPPWRGHEVMAQLPTCRHLACPVSLELMVAPVRLMETGQVYQSTSICSWFAAGGRVSTSLASWSSSSPPAFLGVSVSGSVCRLKLAGLLCMRLHTCAVTQRRQAAMRQLGRMCRLLVPHTVAALPASHQVQLKLDGAC